ncbi:MAG TPA: sensor histidine kinase [Ktedonobacteraceae bacterium]|nr:sensor histidine kinase [Ktedonobacteraceae bacterium]
MIHSNTSTSRLALLPRWKPIIAFGSIAVVVALLVWSLSNYQPSPAFYGPRAIYSMIVLSLFLALLGRVLLLRMLTTEMTLATRSHQREVWRPLFLFDVTAPIYLAAGVLIGIPAAILTAVVTQLLVQGYTMLRGFVSWAEASYRLAASGVIAFISAQVYVWIGGPAHSYFGLPPNIYHLAESKELVGSIVADIVMLLLIVGFSLPIIMGTNRIGLLNAWKAYLHSPVLRFQVLVMSVGPLLSVVDIFDDVAAELAWLFFLVPLFAIYYLALISTRLSIRTSELQGSLQDLSSARRRQDELRDYASLITRVQEEERRRLARELHDDTAQALIALSLGLDSLGRSMGKHNLPVKDMTWLANLQDLADATLDGVRRSCRDLRPSVLDDLGLRAAIEWLSDSSAARGIHCTFTCSGTPVQTTSEAEIAIFRIVQEALSNIWRHAAATKASIHLQYAPNLLEVAVSDNGRGFDPGKQQLDGVPATQHDEGQSGLGLLGMRERAALIGAQLSITSSPGNGSIVTLSLPF